MQILPKSQQKLWDELRAAQDLHFTLYGGTAIALQLGHRTSIDFDFFSDRPLDKNSLKATFPFFQKGITLQDRSDSVTLSIEVISNKPPVKISFFGGLDFGRVGEPLQTEDQILRVASLDDLMAHKLKVILQRSEAKDYLDIAAMINAKVSLEKGLASAKALFGNAFQPSESLKACIFFEDGDLKTLETSVRQTLVRAVAQVKQLPPAAVLSKILG